MVQGGCRRGTLHTEVPGSSDELEELNLHCVGAQQWRRKATLPGGATEMWWVCDSSTAGENSGSSPRGYTRVNRVSRPPMQGGATVPQAKDAVLEPKWLLACLLYLSLSLFLSSGLWARLSLSRSLSLLRQSLGSSLSLSLCLSLSLGHLLERAVR